MLLIWRQESKLYFNAMVIGAILGIFILAPSYDYINAREHAASPLAAFVYMFHQLIDTLTGRISHADFLLLVFYAEIGAVLGVISLILYRLLHKRLQQLDHLKTELDKDLPSIIRQGEGPYLEFKSSLRWDLVENRVNRVLESIVLKTIAGFMNSSIGGTLLLGVADNGEILGLDNDFKTLKKTDIDGFEQAVMTAISSHLGSDVCEFVHILFHVIDKKTVCRIIVSPARRPVYLDFNNMSRFFVRTGAATREMTVQEALAYVPTRWGWHKGI